MTSHIEWIGHAGLAIESPGGAPTIADIQRAVQLSLRWLELDVCCTSDGVLVLHHDIATAGNVPLAEISFAELCQRCPSILTLDQGVEAAGDIRLLLDMKDGNVAGPLGRWLAQRSDQHRFVVCTEDLPLLAEVRMHAPAVERWPSLPDLGRSPRERLGVVTRALAPYRSPVKAARLGGGLIRSFAETWRRPRHGMTHAMALPWRWSLPERLGDIVAETGAAGISVHHSVVSEQLTESALRCGLPIAAWTVNSRITLRRVLRTGVRVITSDHVDRLRSWG